MQGDGYSRFVSAIKVILPLGALGLLSTLFVFSGQVDPTQSIPYRELNVDKIIQEQRLSGPIYRGVTDAGEEILINVGSILPDPANDRRTTFATLDARLFEGDVQTLKVLAPLGEVDNSADHAILTGGTRTETDGGIVALTETLTASLSETYAESAGQVDATGPFGTLTAGKMIISRAGPEADQLITFQDGVKLLYENDEG